MAVSKVLKKDLDKDMAKRRLWKWLITKFVCKLIQIIL